jgi:hypothetical protein
MMQQELSNEVYAGKINYPSIKQLIKTGYRLCCTTVSTAAALFSALSRRWST